MVLIAAFSFARTLPILIHRREPIEAACSPLS